MTTEPTRLIPDAGERERALDPTASYIVQAPAGSGKTTLLAQRYVRLLTRVQRPEEILAITFTKKAAAEMRHRVLALLEQDTPEAAAIRAHDASAGWQLFSNPNVMKVQTIDSFALDVASQTPFAQSAAGLRITKDATAYYEQASRRLLTRLYREDATNPLIAEFLAFLDNDAGRAVRLLSHMLGKRDQWLTAVTAVATNDDDTLIADLLAEAIEALRSDVREQLHARLSADDHAMLSLLAASTGTSDAWPDVFAPLLTKDGSLRRRLTVSQGIQDAEHKRELNAWLQSLHARELATLMASYPRLPETPTPGGEQLRILQLCCICLALAARELEQLMQTDTVLDFTGLLLSAKAALRDSAGPTDLALYLDYRIRHILVDEYQDTSRAQHEFFTLLTEGWQNDGDNTFFAVGDPMQSIYRFRDADVSVFADTRAHGLANVAMTACTLRANFRSDPQLVEWCNGLFDHLFGPSNATQLGEVGFSPATAMVDAHPAAGVRCARFDDPRDETRALLRHVRELLENEPGADIAILCRARPHVEALLEAFAANGIAVTANDMDLLASRPVIRDLMAIHDVLLQPNERLAWFTLLRSPLFGLSLKELTSLAEAPQLSVVLAEPAEHASPSPLARLQRALAWAQPRLYEVPLREVLEGFWLRCGGMDAYPADQLLHAMAWFELVDELRGDAYLHEKLERALLSLFAATDAASSVQVMTIHKAKGLEFDHVLLPYLDRQARHDDPQLLLWRAGSSGLFMGVRGDSVHDWLVFEERERARNEEKRLLYVACTRARRSLFASFSCLPERSPAGLARWLADTAELDTTGAPHATPASPPPNQGDLFKIPYLTRLPADYNWQPPPYAPVASGPPASSAEADVIGARYEVALGQLVHRALAWCADQQILSAEHLEPRLERWARELALDTVAHADLIETCLAHVQNTLADSQGQWLLDSHEDAHSEWPLTGVYADSITRVVLDRTFVADGVRWIVDYKTGGPEAGEGSEQFVAGEVARYTPQLTRYRVIAQAVYGGPVATGLYFTALSRFVPLD